MGAVGVAEIAAQRTAVVSLVRDFEPGVLSATDCALVRQHATAMKNAAAALESLAAARVAETQLATETGAQTAAHDHAVSIGTTKARAQDALDTAARLREQPILNEAVRSGALSLEQAALVSSAAAANPGRERDLVNKAKVDSLRGLRTECDRAKQAADPDPDATQARIHRQRRYKMWTDADVFRLFGETTKAQGIAIRAAIERKTDQLFQAARAEGRREPRDAYAMDALHAICKEWLAAQDHPDGDADTADPKPRVCGSRVMAIMRLDYETIAADKVSDGQICEIDGLGPIDLATARSLLPDSLLYLVITKKGSVAQVINWARGPTREQEIALLWQRAGRCKITGCDHPRLQHDHTIGWAQTHRTILDELQDLCEHHHDLKTRGWTIRDHPDGTVTIEPPAA